jgi:hypothetical protein
VRPAPAPAARPRTSSPGARGPRDVHRQTPAAPRSARAAPARPRAVPACCRPPRRAHLPRPGPPRIEAQHEEKVPFGLRR